MLFIHADDSSLRQILQEVSRLTGMKVLGDLQEERVFGDQGPARASEVLSALLEGTNSNRMLLEDRQLRVTQLILTPRAGGMASETVKPR